MNRWAKRLPILNAMNSPVKENVLLHYYNKRDALFRGIPLHIIFKFYVTPCFDQNTSFPMPQALFAPGHWHRISEFQAQGIGQRNQ